MKRSFLFDCLRMNQRKNKEIGDKGEQLACYYLRQKGYQILETNYRYKRVEVDIIGIKDSIIVFFEVKVRSTNVYGYPEQAVTEDKANRIRTAAEYYMDVRKWDKNIRFDIIAITLNPEIEIMHLEDAFY